MSNINRARKMNWLKGRLMGSKATFSSIVINQDMPQVIKELANQIDKDIKFMLSVWPKHIGGKV